MKSAEIGSLIQRSLRKYTISRNRRNLQNRNSAAAEIPIRFRPKILLKCSVTKTGPKYPCTRREPISRISIHSRTPPAVRLGTGVNRFTPGPLVTPGPRGGSPGVRGRRRGLAGTYPRCWGSAGAAVAGPEPTTGSRLLRVWRGLQLGN